MVSIGECPVFGWTWIVRFVAAWERAESAVAGIDVRQGVRNDRQAVEHAAVLVHVVRVRLVRFPAAVKTQRSRVLRHQDCIFMVQTKRVAE